MASLSTHQNPTARAGIIGCGQIGSLWDENKPANEADSAKTHAKAFYRHPQIDLVALCDTSAARVAAAAKHFEVAKAFTSVDEFLSTPLDIVSLCTPENVKPELLRKILDKKIPVVICEKPLGPSLREVEAIAKRIGSSTSRVLVNYSRRFATGLRDFRQLIQSGKTGSLQSGHAIYGKGLLNNGSHMLNLLQFLIGSPSRLAPLYRVNDDRLGGDSTLGGVLYFAESAVTLQALDHRLFTLFELDLIFSQARLQMTESGLRLVKSTIADDPRYPGYRILKPEPVTSGMEKAMETMVQEAFDLWQHPSAFNHSTVDEALTTMRLVENMRSQIASPL